jgi:DDB1- and CUL4-associated factor 7
LRWTHPRLEPSPLQLRARIQSRVVGNELVIFNGEMPFHRHHHNPSASGPQDDFEAHHSTAGGLGSIGAPARNPRVATSGITSAGTDHFYYPGSNTMSINGGGHTAPPMSSGLPGPGASNVSAPSATISNASQPFDNPRRTQTFGRQPEELHMPLSSNAVGSGQAMHYQPHQEYSGNGAPSINLQQSTPQHTQPPSNSTNNLPGALLPGHPTRPGPSSANTAPSTIPTLPQISTQTQQPTTPSRSATLNHSHAYSRSSPAGLDEQKFKAFANTPDTSKYAPPGSQGYAPSGQQSSSYSPLGLADIRPRADTGYSDGPTSPSVFPHNGELQVPSNSNYLAPWAVYALDWCKWPVQTSNSSAGRVAIGSYLEDSHNFVSHLLGI